MMKQVTIRFIATFFGVFATLVLVFAANGEQQDLGLSTSEEVIPTLEILSPEARDALFLQAKAQYDSGYYARAASSFESLYHGGWSGLEVCYNAGTAHLKAGNLGRAVLYLERAKDFSPADRELQLNSDFAAQLTIDEIEVLPRPLLVSGYLAFVQMMSWSSWLKWAGICAWLAGVFYFVRSTRNLTGRLSRLMLGFSVGLAIASFVMGSVGVQQRAEDAEHHPAVILEDSVYAKNEPSDAATDLFILHEGTVVDAGRTIGSWTKIQLADGKVGWVSSLSLEAI
jgi:tetratricopeptide (TPR) repeat protein